MPMDHNNRDLTTVKMSEMCNVQNEAEKIESNTWRINIQFCPISSERWRILHEFSLTNIDHKRYFAHA